jgi:hypothetical protein
MRKKRIKASDLSEIDVAVRAKSLANHWMWAVSLQDDRITRPRPHDLKFHPFAVQDFHEADLHFLVIALRRLRMVATTLEHAPQEWNSVRSAIQAFDARLPWLKRLRDVFEHLEDYSVDSNLRQSGTSRRELQVWNFGEKGMQWLGYDIDWSDARPAAKDLNRAVIAAYDSLISRRAGNDQAQDCGSR